MSIIEDSRPTTLSAEPLHLPSAGSGPLSGHTWNDRQPAIAAEGQTSPQVKSDSPSKVIAPAGSKASRSHDGYDNQVRFAAADDRPPVQARGSSAFTADAPGLADAMNDFPGGHNRLGLNVDNATGDQVSVPAIFESTPKVHASVRDQVPPAARSGAEAIHAPLLADPLLALAADVLDDLEKVRIANENRLRQLTRSEEDSDGIDTRGWGLDLTHPAVARVAAMVKAMKCDSMVVLELTGEKTPRGKGCCLEHDAEKNLAKHLREHPLGPWIGAQQGVGPKQGARLLAAIGDPYIRPEITRDDGTTEPERPRIPSELWAYCGYHVINGQAPKRRSRQKANWSATAKMRVYLIAVSCMKNRQSPYRAVYDQARTKHADAMHAHECERCGPKGKPAQPSSPLSDGHKMARALREVSKAILLDLWREAKRIHEEASASSQVCPDIQWSAAAGGDKIPPPMRSSVPNVLAAAG